MLAYCVASTLQPKLADDDEQTAYDIALAQTGANVADYWRPTRDNYLSRITRGQLLELGGSIHGDTWMKNMATVKKSDLAAKLHTEFEKPYDSPPFADALKNWLPAGMAFGAAPEPKAAKNKGKPKKREVARSCRVCGCTEDDCSQCIERTGEPCHWVEDDLCSACIEQTAKAKKGRKAA